MTRTLYMESTRIETAKTIQEIEWHLAQAGATGIAKDYGPERRPVSLFFRLMVSGQEVPFMLPVRCEPIYQHLQRKRTANYRQRSEPLDREQAERVAWRQILRWVQAQLALIETGMVAAEEVFLPYIHTGTNQTLFQKLQTGGFKGLLGTGEP